MTDYEPGTVGASRYGRVFRTPDGWVFDDGSVTSDPTPRDFRPLVVLDLDGFDAAAAVRSLDDAANGQLPTPGRYDERRSVVFHVAHAIREQTTPPKPPKPPEPTGLGAVVEDADGVRWVRNPDAGVICKWRNADRCWRNYGSINVARVLSEGVTP